MNLVRRLLHLLLCLVLALNSAALAHAGAASGHVHGVPVDPALADAVHVDAAQTDFIADAPDTGAEPPCHEAADPAASHDAMPMAAVAADDASPAPAAAAMPCCDHTIACEHACMPAAGAAALVPERIAPAVEPLRGAVPAAIAQLRAAPPAHPPVRPPIAA